MSDFGDVCVVGVAPDVFAWLTGLGEVPITHLEEHGRMHNFAASLGRSGGRKGGAARAAQMTADQRSEFASRIARKRWRPPEERTVALGFTEEEELAWLIAEQERDARRGLGSSSKARHGLRMPTRMEATMATNKPAAAQVHGERVWKFTLPAPSGTGRVFVDMPAMARPISVGLQGDEMVVWALCDPDQEAEFMQATGPRRFIVANTGQPIPGFPDGARFLGTLASDNGIVWHVWDGDARTTA